MRTGLERAIGDLIVSVQQSWLDEAGLPEGDVSFSVEYRCHDLLQAAKAGELAGLLGGRSIAGYIGGLWLGPHPQVINQAGAVAAVMANVSK